MHETIPITKTTVEEQIYLRLRQSIFKGSLKAGQRLVQDELAREFGVSRIPIRGALRTLEGTGLVDRSPTGVYTVATFAAGDFDEVTQLRELLEPAAAHAAASRVTKEDLEDLRHLNAELQTCLDPSNRDKWHSFNSQFHFRLYAIAGNRRMLEMIKGLWETRANLGHSKSRADVQKSVDEHNSMIEALASGDADRVRKLVSAHIDISRTKWSEVARDG